MTITADFSGGEKTVTTEPLYQWDTGQKLALSGLPQTASDIQVHFANAAMPQAIVKATELVDNLPTCDIPNEFLQFGSAAKARAWVYYKEGSSKGYTIKTVLIPITPRKRPNDYVSPEDPDSQGIVERAIELLENYQSDLGGKLNVKPIPEGGYDYCTESNTLYYGYVGGYYVYVLSVMVTGSPNQTQYKLRADNCVIECRTRHYSNGAWGAWDSWTPAGREGNIADGAITWAKLAAALQTVIDAKEAESNKKTTLTGNESSNDFYPTTKAVADYLGVNYYNKNDIDDSIYTKSEVDTALAAKANTADVNAALGALDLKIIDDENDEDKKYLVLGDDSDDETEYARVLLPAETTDYAQLSNKPTINNVELSGNKTLAELGINAGSVGFDETGTYADGSIGAVVSNQKNAIGAIEDYTNNQLTNNILSEYDDNFPLKNTFIDSQGRINANDFWSTTDYVKVKPNTYYRLSNAPAGGWFFAAYNANKSRVAGENGYPSKGFTSGSDWEYIRFSFTNPIINAGGVKLFEGASLVNYGKVAFENCGIVLTVGDECMYERLRDAVNDARSFPAAKIVVYPGTYDLTSEFASELASGGKEGILLTGNLHLLFLQGAYVTCEFTDRSHEEFSPFYVAYSTNNYSIKSSNITFEGLNMTAKNCRYCVHDEMYTLTLPYIHKYINCNMKFTCDLTSPKYVQCIGGGLGVSGNIVVDGGVYSVDTLYGYPSVGGDGQNSQQCITYHNSSAATAKSNIRVSNVLLKDRGYFRFSNYGSSTAKTVVCVSGCKTGMPTLQKRENSAAAGDNIELNEWNEEHTVQGHWKLINAFTTQFVPDA